MSAGRLTESYAPIVAWGAVLFGDAMAWMHHIPWGPLGLVVTFVGVGLECRYHHAKLAIDRKTLALRERLAEHRLSLEPDTDADE